MSLPTFTRWKWPTLTRALGIQQECYDKYSNPPSDAGSQFTAIRYGGRLAEIGAVPPIGTVGDSFDNALDGTINGNNKADLIRSPAREGRPWKAVEDVEIATLGWVHWHNHGRLHGYLADVPPAEFKQAPYATNRRDQPLVEIQYPESPSDPVPFKGRNAFGFGNPVNQRRRIRCACTRQHRQVSATITGLLGQVQ